MAVETYSIKKDLSILNTLWLYDTIGGSTPSNYLYTFIGKTSPWPVEDEPPQPYDNTSDYIDTWRNMVSLKRVGFTDLSLAIRKITWTAGTRYSMYDDKNPMLNEEDYYVITSNNKIYKCLDNNNGAESTVEPNSDAIGPYSESDGYKWQLMYKISDNDMAKWINDKVIPAKILTSDDGSVQWSIQSNAVPGSIDAIIIENGGSGYLSTPSVIIEGDGSGATAEAVLSGSSVSKILIRTRGSGYTYANVIIEGNASVRAVISPIKGHGSSVVDELCGRYLIVRSVFDKTENGTFPTDISFRQIGLLMNPKDNNDLPLIEPEGVRQLTDISINTSVSNYIYNETILNQTNNSTATLSSKGDGTLGLTNILGSFNIGDSILGENSGMSSVISAVTPGEVKLYSGQMLYSENREAVQRLDTQAETYKIVIGF